MIKIFLSIFILYLQYCALLFTSPRIQAQEMELIPYRKQNLWGFTSPTGKVSIRAKFKFALPFANKVAPVYLEDGSNKGWVLINAKGEVVSKFYEKLDAFRNGFSIFQENGKNEYGVLSSEGKILTKGLYTRIEMISENRFLVTKEGIFGKYGYINQKGKEVVPLLYDSGKSFSEKRAVVAISVGVNPKTGKKILKYGYIDKKGKEIVTPTYNIAHSFQNGLAAVVKGSKLGFINRKGEVVISFDYDMFDYGVGFFEENVSIVWKENKPMLIDREGKVIIDKGVYDSIEPFKEGRARVGKGNFKQKTIRFGYIDSSGKEIIPCIYNSAYDFSEGVAVVSLGDGKFGFIDLLGNQVTDFKYFYAEQFQNGFGIVKQKFLIDKKENKTEIRETFVDRKGLELTEFKYSSVSPFQKIGNGYYAFVHYKGEDSYLNGGYIDQNGNEFFKE